MQYILDFLRSTTGSKLIQVVIVLTIVFFVVKMLQKGLNKYIKNSTTRYQARKVVSFLGYILALLALMLIYNYKFSNLTLALGVAGAGIAFALQEVIVSIAGFLAILFGNFYKIGDRVKLGGIKGDVVDIGILRTTLMEIGDWVNGDLYNGKMVIHCPNINLHNCKSVAHCSNTNCYHTKSTCCGPDGLSTPFATRVAT